MNYETDVFSAYCCSGANQMYGQGPIHNGDCPPEAILVQQSNVHSCVVAKKKGERKKMIKIEIFSVF